MGGAMLRLVCRYAAHVPIGGIAILALVCGLATTTSAADHAIAESANYRVLGTPVQHLKTIVAYLEVSCADFKRRFRTRRRPGGKMRVRLFESGEAIAGRLQTTHRRTFDGVYCPSPKELWLSGSVVDPQELFSLIRHEGFHQFADFHFGRVLPDWLNEGLAVYFGNARIGKKKIEHGWIDAHVVGPLYQRWDTPDRPRLDWLLSTDYQALHTQGAEWANYSMAWLFCAWLIEDAKNGQRVLNNYIQTRIRRPDAQLFASISDTAKIEEAMKQKLTGLYERWSEEGRPALLSAKRRR